MIYANHFKLFFTLGKGNAICPCHLNKNLLNPLLVYGYDRLW